MGGGLVIIESTAHAQATRWKASVEEGYSFFS